MASNVSYISTHDPEAAVTQFEYLAGDPIYKGTNTVYDAADSDTNWVITKYTWSSGDVTKIQILTGSWTGRASLGWT